MTRALLLLVFVTAASADVVKLPNTRTTLDLPTDWKTVETPGVVLGAKGPSAEILAITRAQVPNADAWKTEKKKEAYADQIEKGLAATIKGYKRTSRKIVQTNAVPTLEIEAKREDGATILVRVILYRSYALSLAIEVPRSASPKGARAIIASFAPPPTTTSASAP